MNDNLPYFEIPERLTTSDTLATAIDFAKEAVTLCVGYEVGVGEA